MTTGKDTITTNKPARTKAKRKTAKASKKKTKPKKVKAPKEPLVVFAFRLTAAERDLIHKAAGPANASKFLKAAAFAAAHGDSKAFEGLTAQAKTTLT